MRPTRMRGSTRWMPGRSWSRRITNDHGQWTHGRNGRNDVKFTLFRRYTTKTLLSAGGRMREGTMYVLDPCRNGDGGVLYKFDKVSSRWSCKGVGRFRYCRGRDAFPEQIEQLEPT